MLKPVSTTAGQDQPFVSNRIDELAVIKKEIGRMALVALPMVLTPAFNMLFMIVVAREVDVQVYGSLAYVLALIALLAGFSDLGLRDYFLSKGGVAKDYANANSLFIFSCTLFLLIAAIQYFFWIRSDTDLLLYIFLALLVEGCALGVLHKIVYYKYQSENRLPYFSRCDSLLKIMPASLKITIFIVFGDLVLALVLGGASVFLVYAFWLVRIGFFAEFKSVLVDGFGQLGKLLKDWRSWGVFSVSFLSFFLFFGADKLVVQFVLGVEHLAVYSAAMAFMAIGQIAVGVLWSLYMPRLSRGEVLWSYKGFILILGLLGILAFGVYQIISYWVYGYIYPEAYSHGAHVLSVASFYFVFRFPNVAMEIFYILDGCYLAFVRMRMVLGVLAVIGCFLLLPVVGIVGAALALVVAEMLLMIGSILGRRRLNC